MQEKEDEENVCLTQIECISTAHTRMHTQAGCVSKHTWIWPFTYIN